MNIEGTLKGKKQIEFNETNYSFIEELDKISEKLTFKASEDFIFSYSYIDLIDQYYEQNFINKSETEELNNLKIVEIKNKNSDNNIITVKFYPNYKNISTKYIIVIILEEGDNNIEKIKNPCYLTKLVNEKPTNIKVMNLIDIGEKEFIETEIDINSIINSNKKYIINIISQELRYDKKINFYEPKQFTVGKEEDETNNDNDNTALIVSRVVVGAIILLLVIFLIVRYIKKRKNNELLLPEKNIDLME